MMSRPQPAYEKSVFINCPFDADFRDLLLALVFSVAAHGFLPRSARETEGTAEPRISRILQTLAASKYSIHDLSRFSGEGPDNLARFNMPLELGLFLGAQRFGSGKQKRKSCLILDCEPFRYQKFISDIAGQDISSHDGNVVKLIGKVRDWLGTATGGKPLPGGAKIAERFTQFSAELPVIASAFHVNEGELTFKNYAYLASEWLRARLPTAGDPLA